MPEPSAPSLLPVPSRHGFAYGVVRYNHQEITRLAVFGANYIGVTDEQIDQLYGVLAVPEVAEAAHRANTLFLQHARKLGIVPSPSASPLPGK